MRITPRHERAEQRARDLEKVIRIIDNTPTTTITTTAKQIGYRSGEGDRQRMRAIPVIAEAVGGTIPGTDPLNALIEKEAAAERTAA